MLAQNTVPTSFSNRLKLSYNYCNAHLNNLSLQKLVYPAAETSYKNASHELPFHMIGYCCRQVNCMTNTSGNTKKVHTVTRASTYTH